MTEPKIKVEGYIEDWRKLEFLLNYKYLIVYEGTETQMFLRSLLGKIMTKMYNYKKLHERKVFGKMPPKKLKVSFGRWEFEKFYLHILPVVEHAEISSSLWLALYDAGANNTDLCCMKEYDEREKKRKELSSHILDTETLN